VVSLSVFEEVEEVQHLCSRAEMDGSASLPQRQSCDPNRNESVLTKGKAKLRMPGDLEEKLTVAACVKQPTIGRPAKREPAEDEWPCMEGQVLGMVVTLVADELDRFELLDAALRDSD
jgi:hypothetical protein